MEHATRFRSGPHYAGFVNDYARACHPPLLLAVANAFDSGFATRWPPGSRLLLDALVAAWHASPDTPDIRLQNAVVAACSAFQSSAADVEPRDPDFLDDGPAAVLVAAVVWGAMVQVRWVGGGQAVLVRDGAAVNWTSPHSLHATIRAEQPLHPEALPEPIPNIHTRLIQRDPSEVEPDVAEFAFEPGDLLVLLDKPPLRAGEVTPEEVARLVSSRPPADAADILVDYLIALPSAGHAACAVARLDR